MRLPNIAASFAAVGGAPSLAAETVVGTFNPVATSGPNAPVHLSAYGVCTPGATTTALVVRIRRGTAVAGTLVGSAITITVTAANAWVFQLELDDTPGDVSGQQYVVTIQQTGGTGNGTTADVYCMAIAE